MARDLLVGSAPIRHSPCSCGKDTQFLGTVVLSAVERAIDAPGGTQLRGGRSVPGRFCLELARCCTSPPISRAPSLHRGFSYRRPRAGASRRGARSGGGACAALREQSGREHRRMRTRECNVGRVEIIGASSSVVPRRRAPCAEGEREGERDHACTGPCASRAGASSRRCKAEPAGVGAGTVGSAGHRDM